MPMSKHKNEQTVAFEISGVEGCLTVPKVLEAEDFDRWYQEVMRTRAAEGATEWPAPQVQRRRAAERVHLIKSYDFPFGPTLDEMQSGADPLPAVALQIIDATEELLESAMSPPKLRGGSSVP